MVTQLAREFGAYVIGTGRAADRQKALAFGAQEFVDLDSDTLEDVGGADLVFDVIGGDIGKRSARLIRTGGTLVTIAGPTEAWPADGLAIDFVLVPDRAQLSQIVQRVRDGRLRTNIGNIATVSDTRPSMHAAGRRCPDRPAASYQPRRGQPGKLVLVGNSVRLAVPGESGDAHAGWSMFSGCCGLR
jgi:NADPH:quinone reductase-like Zn-dependent oxidoreductase